MRIYQIQRRGLSPWQEFVQQAPNQIEKGFRYFQLTETKNPMSNINIADAVVGTEVILLPSNRFGDSQRNPAWGGSQGKVKGVIKQIVQPHYIVVLWENGFLNHYDNNCLATVPVEVKAVSLQAAVESVIATVIAAGESFSGYDITSKLRREVNEKRIVLENRPYEDVNGIQTQKVTHDEVRTFVRGYMDTISSYDRRFNGDYIVYSPNGTLSTSTTATTTPASVAPKTLTYTPTAVVSTPAVAVSASTSPSTKLVSYIRGRGPRTLKQIQSRFKVEGAAQPTVRDLAAIAQSSGLRIDVKTPYYASVVTT